MIKDIKKIVLVLALLPILAAASCQNNSAQTSVELDSAGLKKTIKNEVPFTAQAPFAEWSDARQQDGCEEASALMAVSWGKGVTSLDPTQAKKDIVGASDWELEKYGNFRDTSAQDTADRIIKGYFNYSNVSVKNGVTADDIVKVLEEGKLVIIPANGRLLGNPYFTGAGPERHMVVIIGYDYSKKQFITNDPGSRYGKGFRYGKTGLFNAIRDYPSDTGSAQTPIVDTPKNIIIIGK